MSDHDVWQSYTAAMRAPSMNTPTHPNLMGVKLKLLNDVLWHEFDARVNEMYVTPKGR